MVASAEHMAGPIAQSKLRGWNQPYQTIQYGHARKQGTECQPTPRKEKAMCSCIECIGDQPEPTVEELAAYEAEMVAADEAYKKPPCQRCGAMTEEESATKCRVGGGDDDHCHGGELWPD